MQRSKVMNYHQSIQLKITIAAAFVIIIGTTFTLTRRKCSSIEQRRDDGKLCGALSSIESKIFGDDTTIDNTDDSHLWDLSLWKMENVNDLRRTVIEMHKYELGGDDLEKTSSARLSNRAVQSTRRGGNGGAIMDDGEIDNDASGGRVGETSTTSRRLRSKNYQPRRLQGGEGSSSHLLEQQQQEDKWNEDAEGMEGELMQYFVKESGDRTKQKRQKKVVMGGATRPNTKTHTNNKAKERSSTTMDRHHKPALDTVHRKAADQQTQFSLDNPFSPNCTDPNADLECPPEDLPQKCDRYNGGTMEDCYERCTVSFCCIHDSKSQFQSPSCSRQLNCKNWAPCYIVWWKLHDTIGPENFVRVAQNEPFYNINLQTILDDNTVDNGADVTPFYRQWFFHHFDDDTFQTNDFVENPANW